MVSHAGRVEQQGPQGLGSIVLVLDLILERFRVLSAWSEGCSAKQLMPRSQISLHHFPPVTYIVKIAIVGYQFCCAIPNLPQLIKHSNGQPCEADRFHHDVGSCDQKFRPENTAAPLRTAFERMEQGNQPSIKPAGLQPREKSAGMRGIHSLMHERVVAAQLTRVRRQGVHSGFVSLCLTT
jgi:hypothetical protein